MQVSVGPCRCPHRDPPPRHSWSAQRSSSPAAAPRRATRAQELLQQAEQAQTTLHSATFEADARRRHRRRADRRGGQGCGLEGGRGHLGARDRHPRGIGPGLSARRPRQPRLDEHHRRHVDIDAGAEGDERQERLDGRRRVPGARPLRPGRTRRRAPADRRQAGDDDRRRDRHSRAAQGRDEARLALRARRSSNLRSPSTSTTSA